MKRVLCCPEAFLPKQLDPDVLYFTMFSTSSYTGIGHVAIMLPKMVRKYGLMPSVKVWDFVTIALAVAATDKAIQRKDSADGWTRIIELSVCLNEPAVWDSQRTEMEALLRFLTGDFWTLHFLPGDTKVPAAKKSKNQTADCVCLLSGGIDSLVGSIDLTSSGRKPLFVSQVVKGEKNTQTKFAAALGSLEHHCQWSFAFRHPDLSDLETSTRARSIVFFAFAVLAASAIRSDKKLPVEVIVPENGFISLNVPLGPGRLGSLSTKTTHPVYMARIQALWDAVGIPCKFSTPYLNRTKGELLSMCFDQKLLVKLIGDSVSCGKYQRHNLTHCGECVPCMVRRAAFIKANLQDTTTKGYIRLKLTHSSKSDVAAVASAYLQYIDKGAHRFTGGALSFAKHDERKQYEAVVARGMDELGQLLGSHGVI